MIDQTPILLPLEAFQCGEQAGLGCVPRLGSVDDDGDGAAEVGHLRMQPEQQMGLVLYFKSAPLTTQQLDVLKIYNAILVTTFPQQVNMFFLGLDADRRYTTQMDVEVQQVSINFEQ